MQNIKDIMTSCKYTLVVIALTPSLLKYLPKQMYTIPAKKNNLNKFELEHS